MSNAPSRLDPYLTGGIAECHAQACAGFAEKPAILHSDFTLTHAELLAQARALALGMRARGMVAGQKLWFESKDLVAQVVVTLAASRLGLPLVGSLSAGEVGVDHLLWDGIGTPPASAGLSAQVVGPDWLTTPPGAPFGEIDPDAPWMFGHTSGSTGVPKFVALSQRMLLSRAETNHLETALPTLCLMPPGRSYWFSHAFGALMTGGALVIAETAEEAMRLGARCVTGSVQQHADLIARSSGSWRIAIGSVGGGRPHEGLLRDMLAHYDRVTEHYGSTEAGRALCHRKTLGADGEIETSAAQLWPGVTLELVDGSGVPVAPGSEGAVRLRSPHMAGGYLGDPETSRDALRDGWFHPGDRAVWLPSGELRILGRDADQLNLGGVKVNALLLDMLMMAVPGVREAISFASEHPQRGRELYAMVRVTDPSVDTTALQTDLRVAILAAQGKSWLPRRFLFVDEVPKGAAGKPSRDMAAQLLTKFRQKRGLGENPLA